MKKGNTTKMILAALFLAFGILLPIIFHTVNLAGDIFLPMHIPVMLCGFICGSMWGGVVGIFVVFLSSAITGMPPLYPVALFMACELATYGIVCGLFRKVLNPIVTLIIAMICGRLVLGIVQYFLLTGSSQPFVLNTFITSAFVTAIPGIIVQLILVPIIIIALKKARLIPIGERS